MQILNKDSICLLTVDSDTLCGADLSAANLYCADLRYADLRAANLCAADLRAANLCAANLHHVNLRYANLRDAKINWNSHDLIAEILRQNAREDIEKLQIPGLIILLKDRCWDYFLKLDHPQKGWAIQVLKDYGCKKITN